ncbi:hypothetical protein [Methyloceanibacter stevinii]|nr:hypothetical protein [Methyloceanibacter stevinii]
MSVTSNNTQPGTQLFESNVSVVGELVEQPWCPMQFKLIGDREFA